MYRNVALDLLLGAVPLIGDLFDVGFKANLRNLRLLEEDLKRHRGNPTLEDRPDNEGTAQE